MYYAKKGKKFTAEHLANMSKSQVGHKFSEEAKEHMSEAAMQRRKVVRSV